MNQTVSVKQFLLNNCIRLKMNELNLIRVFGRRGCQQEID